MRKNQSAPFDQADITDDFMAFYDKFPELEVTIRRYRKSYSIAFVYRNDYGGKEFCLFRSEISAEHFERDFHKHMGELRVHLEREL